MPIYWVDEDEVKKADTRVDGSHQLDEPRATASQNKPCRAHADAGLARGVVDCYHCELVNASRRKCGTCGLFMRRVDGQTWRCERMAWDYYYGAWEHQ